MAKPIRESFVRQLLLEAAEAQNVEGRREMMANYIVLHSNVINVFANSDGWREQLQSLRAVHCALAEYAGIAVEDGATTQTETGAFYRYKTDIEKSPEDLQHAILDTAQKLLAMDLEGPEYQNFCALANRTLQTREALKARNREGR